MKSVSSTAASIFDERDSDESFLKIRAADDETTKGTGECLYVGCTCKGYVDDGSGLYKCTCGHRKSDHSSS